MNRKVAFFLSGSGHLDGTEITEAVTLRVALAQHGFDVVCFAPNRSQTDVINHQEQEAMPELRNILVESSRIARGNIAPIDQFDASEYVAVIMPGGFGAVKNFTNFIEKGNKATLMSDIGRALNDAIAHHLWIVAICAAPLVAAIAMRNAQKAATVSFGAAENAGNFLPALNDWNINHIDTKLHEGHTDIEHKLITSGAYMFHEATPYDISLCTGFVIEELLKQLTH
ncbi:isoprenoid biosynthesis glyoxalase ElbB [Wohlfahrtiimonas chitiniclastica]|uniref:isoprenoid biosynthesis glyoxalase ElbB n=1 Tax=Wohlfahrtiimonas chitiniclastica TaxID=400946 RepID=UPI0024B9018C|nr:isoprenoid biosynthesis glyoxalase ElbB [Wohlfahrtiimonas chitiniclastica]WHR54704.1 isoprenoid biosynthesis glyoxalase ElbB [Wohlfahrtiimonas chitiniclastica]